MVRFFSLLTQQALLVALVLDLMDQGILGPAELSRHAQVEFAFERVSAPLQNNQIVAPSYFSHK